MEQLPGVPPAAFEKEDAEFYDFSRQHARFAIFAPQKGERVSNQALEPEFSDSNILPVEPSWPKTRNE
jgi:hypothetical protein